MSRTSVSLVVLLSLAAASAAQAQPAVTKANSVTATATIQAIDSTTRHITLRTDKGEEDTFVVGPAVARFNELKVGDKIKMTYYESMVLVLRKPGEKTNPSSDTAALAAAKSALPGGTVSMQEKRTVTVKAVDPSVPSITVTTDDGRTISRKIENKKNLEGVKPGDKIDITYTEALLTSVER
jgi:Cu/Ag efflux protein CusF